MGKFCEFLTVICPQHDNGGGLWFHICYIVGVSMKTKKVPGYVLTCDTYVKYCTELTGTLNVRMN